MSELEHKNNLVLRNEHIFKKYFPNIGELARISNLRIEIEEELTNIDWWFVNKKSPVFGE